MLVYKKEIISFQKALQMKYAPFLREAWQGKEKILANWPSDLREWLVFKGLAFEPVSLKYNGADFENKKNTKFIDPWDAPELIRYAPVLRRFILPNEIVIDIDMEDRREAVRRARWIISALETLDIPYALGFTGNRGFHIHIIFRTDVELPRDPPEGFNAKLFKEAILNLITASIGGILDGIDLGTAGVRGNHPIREFFSINEKTQAFKLPVQEPEIVEVRAGEEIPEEHAFYPYRIWTPSRVQLEEILEEVERLLHGEPSRERVAPQKPGMASLHPKPTSSRTTQGNGRGSWRQRYIRKYIEALKRYGMLTADPEIVRRHGNEYKACVWFCALLLEEGWTEDQIVDVFRHASYFKEDRTRYYTRSVRKWLERKRGGEIATASPSRKAYDREEEGSTYNESAKPTKLLQPPPTPPKVWRDEDKMIDISEYAKEVLKNVKWVKFDSEEEFERFIEKELKDV